MLEFSCGMLARLQQSATKRKMSFCPQGCLLFVPLSFFRGGVELQGFGWWHNLYGLYQPYAMVACMVTAAFWHFTALTLVWLDNPNQAVFTETDYLNVGLHMSAWL